MKVSIIGGGGRVGSNAAFALQLGGVVKEIVISDMNAEMAEGEALDLRHGSALTSPQIITSGGYEAVIAAAAGGESPSTLTYIHGETTSPAISAHEKRRP